MSEHVTVDCLECGEEIEFEVETWADPPKRAFCGEACFDRHEAEKATAATSSV